MNDTDIKQDRFYTLLVIYLVLNISTNRPLRDEVFPSQTRLTNRWIAASQSEVSICYSSNHKFLQFFCLAIALSTSDTRTINYIMLLDNIMPYSLIKMRN